MVVATVMRGRAIPTWHWVWFSRRLCNCITILRDQRGLSGGMRSTECRSNSFFIRPGVTADHPHPIADPCLQTTDPPHRCWLAADHTAGCCWASSGDLLTPVVYKYVSRAATADRSRRADRRTSHAALTAALRRRLFHRRLAAARCRRIRRQFSCHAAGLAVCSSRREELRPPKLFRHWAKQLAASLCHLTLCRSHCITIELTLTLKEARDFFKICP